jgi:hypothetical protein
MQRAALLVSTVVVFAAGCDESPTAVPAVIRRPVLNAVSSTQKIPIDETYVGFGECTQEAILFTLREQLVLHETVDAAGGFHSVFVLNDKGTTGVGLTSGMRYHQTGATVESIHATEPDPFVDSFLFLLNLVAQGPAPDLRLHLNAHITVNANGELTALVENVRIECR